MSQAYGRSSFFFMWLFSCSFKYFNSFVEKSHFLQSYQIFLCVSTCSDNSPFLLNQRPHLGYMHLWEGCSQCTTLWASNSLLKKQWKSHLSQWCLLTLWLYMWWASVVASSNILPHTPHICGLWFLRWCSFRASILVYVSMFRTLDIYRLCPLDVFCITHIVGFWKLLWIPSFLPCQSFVGYYRFLALRLYFYPLILGEFDLVLHDLSALILAVVLQVGLAVRQLMLVVMTDYEFGFVALW